MAKSNSDKSEPAEYLKWNEEQDNYWAALRQKLEFLKKELDSSDLELAKGLGVSPQVMASFMDGSRTTGLPINRSSLLKLWWYLTDEKSLEAKRLSKAAKERRLETGKESPDKLLIAGGFLPTAPILNAEANIYAEVRGVVTRLRRFSEDDRYAFAFSRLIKDIEELISKAFLEEKDIKSLKAIEDWWNSQGETDKLVSKQFWKAIDKLLASGKDEFTFSELFELWQAIKNNVKLKKSCLRMRISKCEFTTLTFSLQNYYSGNEIPEIIEELRQVSSDAEKEFYRTENKKKPSKEDGNENGENQPAPIIGVSITCCFSNEEVRWEYSSNASHFENMLAALEKGLGHLAQLELIHFSNIAQGKQDYSLAKNSVVYKSKSNQRYSGVWVEPSIVIGSLQAVVVAVTTWLCEFLGGSKQQENYYKVCRQVAEIEQNIWKARNELDECSLKHSKYRETGGKDDVFIRKSLNEEISAINSILNENQQNQQINDLFGNNLKRQVSLAYLTNARLAHAQGNLQEAQRALQNKLWNESVPIKVLKDVENVAQEWLSGSSKFTYRERSKLDNQFADAKEQLNNYIYEEDLKLANYKGRFDFDVCLAASELFGSVARLDFYFCQADNPKDVERLKTSIPNFLKSAYYSAKIGRRQRAAQWLAYVSRNYSRLGEGEKANAYANLAKKILIHKMEPGQKDRYQLAILADVNLALGEKLLLIDKQYREAIPYFLRSLKGAIYLGFFRIIADSLYGIARAARNEGNYIIFASFKNSGIFDEDVLKRKKREDESRKEDEQAFQGEEKLFNEKDQAWEGNEIVIDVISFLNRLNTLESWSKVAKDFEARAKNVWHQLLLKSDSEANHLHPIEEEIDRGTFLNRLE